MNMKQDTARPRRIFPSLARVAITAMILAAALVAGCSSLERTILQRDELMEVYRITAREMPAEPAAAELSPIDSRRLMTSLRRITFRYATITALVFSDPVSLLTDIQAEYMHEVLLRELPGLRPEERIGFQFFDQYKGGLVDVEIYQEGVFLVYHFRTMIRMVKDIKGPGPKRPPLGKLAPIDGQTAEEGPHPTLREDLSKLPSDDDEEIF